MKLPKQFADLLPAALKPIAKAVAVFVTTLLVAGLAWVVDRTGVDVPYDPDAIETVVTAILLAFVTWATTNVPIED